MTTEQKQDEAWMAIALDEAARAAAAGEVPVGAVLVEKGEMLVSAHNAPIMENDPTAHAEILALRRASQFKNNYRLPGTTLYVTIEPCTMCVGAIVHARVNRLVFGAPEPRAGAVISQQRLLDVPSYNHQVEYVGGVLAEECGRLLQDFFRSKR